MMSRTCLTIILAAGQGSRMKSDLPKVLHPIGGLPMVLHVAECANKTGSTSLAVVVGHGAEPVRAALKSLDQPVSIHAQEEQLGTANAVNAARTAIDAGHDDVLVLFGDTPLIQPEALIKAREQLAQGAAVCVVGFRTKDPTGYGRMLEKDGELIAIREHKDATEEERVVNFCNGGLMAFNGRMLGQLLDRIGNDNAKGEFYLTDAVEVARSVGLPVTAIEAPQEQLLGVNTRAELAQAEAIWQQRQRERFLLAGVSMIAPETVFFHHDTQIAADVSLEPNIVFGPGVNVATGANIRAYSHIEGANIGEEAEVGPFARLRPGADLGAKSKVGNFCEVKNANLGEGTKVNHLTYIGDADIGSGSNIGAGTITCNYDGANKHRTIIGNDVFIGSNSSLVAPVSINDNAYVGSGSVITVDVPADALAIARARQANKEGLAKRLKEKVLALKEKR
ncbi:MAG: bifunctional UDP-N-acetylglucosamine diphosphorylase/glucosamine-1-phosphate N-acetyltransferase GlmU, partial [Pseudomonadota bacterium]